MREIIGRYSWSTSLRHQPVLSPRQKEVIDLFISWHCPIADRVTANIAPRKEKRAERKIEESDEKRKEGERKRDREKGGDDSCPLRCYLLSR